MKALLTTLALAAAALAMAAGPAAAQLDPNLFTLSQLERGQWVERGEIFVPDKPDRDNYLEHWILYPGYTYPSQTTDVTMRFASPDAQPAGEAEFFAQRFPDGARYVLVEAHEYDTVPSAPPTAR